MFGRHRPSEAPMNTARAVSEDELALRCRAAFEAWEPRSDVWALRYGPVILGATAGLPVVPMVGKLMRSIKHVGGNMRLIQAVGCLLPMSAGLIGAHLIQRDILLGTTPCSVCVEVRATCFGAVSGVILPFVTTTLGTWANLAHHTARGLPARGADVMPWLARCGQTLQGPLTASLAVQVVLAVALTYLQFGQWRHMQAELQARMEDPDVQRRIQRDIGLKEAKAVEARAAEAQRKQ